MCKVSLTSSYHDQVIMIKIFKLIVADLKRENEMYSAPEGLGFGEVFWLLYSENLQIRTYVFIFYPHQVLV